MNRHIFNKIKGSVSILLIIILIPVMVLSAVVVDTSRINMARSMTASAGDLAMNTALANYDTILKDVYGLFAMSQDKTPEQMNDDIKEYFKTTLVSYGVVTDHESGAYVDSLLEDFKSLIAGSPDDEQVANFMGMQIIDNSFKVAGVANSGLDNPDILRKQILEYTKYRVPLDFGLSFLDSLKSFKNVEKQSTVVETQVKAQEKIQTVSNACDASIKAIREYDKMVKKIESDASGTSNTKVHYASSRLEEYTDVINGYKSGRTDVTVFEFGTGSATYKNINRLALVFLLKPVDITPMYLSGMNGTYFINDDNTIHTTNCGIPEYTGPKGATPEEAIEKIKSTKTTIEGLVSSLSSYNNELYFNGLWSSDGELYFNDFDNAEKSFTAFESFLLNKNTASSDVKFNYSDVANLLNSLRELEAYYSNFTTIVNQAITNAKATEEEKKGIYDGYTAEKTTAENAAAELSTAQTTQATKLTEKNTAYTAWQSATNPAVKAAKKILYDNAVTAYDNATADVATKQAVVDSCRAVSEIEADVNSSEADYLAAKSVREGYENLKTEGSTAFTNIVSSAKTVTRVYQTDIAEYKRCQECAKRDVTSKAQGVQTEMNYIRTNLDEMISSLGGISTKLQTVIDNIDTYIGEINKWEAENNSYKSESGQADSFSKQNESDINDAKTKYDKTVVEKLKTDIVDNWKTKINNYKISIDTGDTVSYNGTKIFNIGDADTVVNLIKASGIMSTISDEIITAGIAESKLDSLYSSSEIGYCSVFIDESEKTKQKQYMYLYIADYDPYTYPDDNWVGYKKQSLPIQFLKFLDANYPEAEKAIEPGNAQKDKVEADTTSPKEKFKKIKQTLKDNKNKDVDAGDTSPSTFGYTYESRSLESDLPSSGYSKKTAPKSTKGASINTSGDEDKEEIDASSSVSDQKSGVSNILKNIGSAISAGVENVYILSYMFENFSYNTVVQNEIVDTNNVKNVAQWGTTVTGSGFKYEDYIRGSKAPKTMSNFKISPENNYLYGAEIEYLLWGNSNPSTNVKYTKASIYALRFAFNCIFAFSDSEIRATTKSIGLAVQAATLGFVPYILVQIVCQLALAAAESAIDLSTMNKGLKVVVIKSKDTWSMSLTGAANMIKDYTTEAATKCISAAVGAVNDGFQKVVDASADKLNGAINDLSGDVSKTAKAKAEEIADAVFLEAENLIDSAIDEIGYTDFAEGANATKAGALSAVDGVFSSLKTEINKIPNKYDGLAKTVAEKVINEVTKSGGMLDGAKAQITQCIEDTYKTTVPDVGAIISDKLLDIKTKIVDSAVDTMDGVISGLEDTISGYVSDIQKELKDAADEFSAKATEEAAKVAKEKISSTIDNFSNDFLKDKDTIGGGAVTGDGGNSFASMIKFGYKEYLMLMTYIAICANDDGVLARTADLIQLNISKASTTPASEGAAVSQFEHCKKGEFKMANAKTYVSIEADVKVDMLFLNMDLFSNFIVAEGTTVDEKISPVATIKYKSVLGY